MSKSATAVAFLVIVSTVAAQDRLSIPNEAAQKEADELVQMVFGDEIRAARKSDEKLALTKKLLAEAAKPDTSPAGRYAILKTALDVAPSAEIAMLVIDNIARHFQVDALRAKAYTIRRMSKEASGRSQCKALAESAIRLANSYAEQDNFKAALVLIDNALALGTRSRDSQLIQDIQPKKEEFISLQKEFAIARAALAKLETDPANAEANASVGTYKCFVKGNWDEGLPMLALGDDAPLKELATKELDEPKVSNEQVALADGWYDLAQKSNEAHKERMLQRAGFWYRLSLSSTPALPRLTKAKVEKRLEACRLELAHTTGPLPVSPYALRSRRTEAVRVAGGNDSSENAVEEGLRWLASHQNGNGSWSFVHTVGDKCSGFPNPGEKKTRMGATGLALLPFLGAGYTHQAGEYSDTVRRGISYLITNMDKRSGRLYEAKGEGHSHMYSHGICAAALAEAYGMTHDRKLKLPAQMGIKYILNAQHLTNGGWLYNPRQGGDTSVTGWQIMALRSGTYSKLPVPIRNRAMASKWLSIVQWDVPKGGRFGAAYGYRKPKDRPSVAATTAIGLIGRTYLDAKFNDPGVRLGIERLVANGITPGNMYFNYYASMAIYQNDGPNGALWRKWNTQMRDYLTSTQVKQGSEQGSWFFSGGHDGKAGGRLCVTALCLLTLETYYRYAPANRN